MQDITDAYVNGNVQIGELEKKRGYVIGYCCYNAQNGERLIAEANEARELIAAGYELVHVLFIAPSIEERKAIAAYNRMLDKARHLSKRAKKVRQRRKNRKRLRRLYMQQHKYLR